MFTFEYRFFASALSSFLSNPYDYTLYNYHTYFFDSCVLWFRLSTDLRSKENDLLTF